MGPDGRLGRCPARWLLLTLLLLLFLLQFRSSLSRLVSSRLVAVVLVFFFGVGVPSLLPMQLSAWS